LAKWEKRYEEITNRERRKHNAVWRLADQLEKLIHGFSPISRKELKKEIAPVIESVELVDSVISEVKYENRYKTTECEENNMILTIDIVGDFNGSIVIETGQGTRSTETGRTPIFYVFSCDKKVYSNRISEMKRMYEKYHNYSVELLTDLFFDKQIYLNYNDYFKSYEMCDKKPSEYGDSITGNLDNKKDWKIHKRAFDNLKKLKHSENIMEYAEEKLYGVNDSVKFEWIEYKL